MQTHLIDLLRGLTAVLAGVGLGYCFGLLQREALRRNEERQRNGKLHNPWSLMPGSGARVAYLLIALALVQLVCPLLFVDGTQWLVSAGLLAGYGWTLTTQLRHRLKSVTR